MNKPLRLKNNDPKVFYTYCSHCRDDSGHMEVDLHQGVYYCHKCGHGGRLQIKPEPVRWNPPSLKPEVPFKFHHTTALQPEDQRYKYLLDRGFSSEMIEHDLQPIVTDFDLFIIYFPVLDEEGEMVYIVGRNTSAASKCKWIFPPSRPDRLGKSHFFWGLNRWYPTVYGSKRVVLVEGIFDAVWDDDRLAMLGSTPSQYQLSLLQELWPEEIVIALDGDMRERSFEVGAMVARVVSVPIWVALLPTDDDPDTLGLHGTDYINKVKVRMA